MNDHNILHTHYRLPIHATAAAWKALGYGTYSNGGVQGGSTQKDELLALGLLKFPTDHNRVIAWAAEEHQRRCEATTSATAQAREAEALNNLANALRTASAATEEGQLLDRIMGRLTEKTQFALKQQLGLRS